MLARSFRSAGLITLVVFAMSACASTTPTPSRELPASARIPSLSPMSRVLDAERIHRSSAQTAWDAIRLLVPSYRFQSARGALLQNFGGSDLGSIHSPIRLVIDGHLTGDLDALRAIPARDVIAIHVLNATDAGMYVGPGSAGAIVVQTRNALRQR